jgi:hypothetical protein
VTAPPGQPPMPFGFGPSTDGGVVAGGWPCPSCGHDVAEVLHLEPPYGALVKCCGTVEDPDWGIRRPCAHEHPIAF